MESFAPGLRENVIALTVTLRGVVFFLCVAGFMVQVSAARHDSESLMRPLIRATVVVGLIATLPYWFESTEKLFLSVANLIEEGYTEHPMRAASLLRDRVEEKSDSTFSLRRIGESLHRAFLWAAAKLIVLVGSLLQLPFLLLQYILKLLCYLFLPVALGLFMVPSRTSLGVRYLQRTLAVLAWPIGFAVTELVAYHLVTAYQTNLAIVYGLAPGQLDASSLASILGGLLGALWLILGTIGTPFLMQMLFCSGTPVSGGGLAALQQVASIRQTASVLMSIKAGSIAAPLMATPAAAKAGTNGSGPMPPPSSPMAPPPPRAPVPPKSDPAGDSHAAAVSAQAQLPAAQTTI